MIERALLGIDDGAFGALYRIAIGYLTIPAMSLLFGVDGSSWLLVPFLLSILLLLRLIPAVLRKLLPFSDSLRDTWATRRRLAKKYDSYQWRKLLWIGIGLTLYAVVPGKPALPLVIVSSICLVGGAAGLTRWKAVQSSETAILHPGKAKGAQ